MCILNSTGPHIKASIKAFLYLYNQYILHTRVNYTRKPMSMSPVHVYSNVHLSPIIQCLFHFLKNSNEFYAQSFPKKITVSSFNQTSFLFNLMILIPFLASLIRHHRPSLCSWPIPATNTCPSGEKARLFTKPTYIKGKITCMLVSFIYYMYIKE